jgi:uncharacterized YigZ family protein
VPEIASVTRPHRHELEKIKGSRFLALVAPAATVTTATAVLDARRGEFADATHHCWAFRGRTRDVFRYSDDGEPSGSAGRPILHAIDGRGLADVVIVVTRYFGGTKLGTGGLVRAYGQAAAAVLEHATIIRTRTTQTLTLRFAYELTGAVHGVLAAYTLEPTQSDYGADVELLVAVPEEDVERFQVELGDRCAGQITCTR